jgi:hypothetical protein
MNTEEKHRTAFRKGPLLGSFAAGLLLLSSLLLLFAGCNPKPTVTGVVCVDGEPLARGSISFVPVDDRDKVAGDRGPGGGSPIVEGKYNIEKGLTIGKYRIEIQGVREEPRRKMLDPFGLPVTREVNVVPPEYNTHSNLIRDVKAGSNTIDFPALKGIKKGR